VAEAGPYWGRFIGDSSNLKKPLWYTEEMTKLAALIEEVKRWPQERQRDVEHVLEAMIEGGTETYQVSDLERQLIDECLGSRVVSDAELKTFRNRHKA
jgi:hypothetical protein